MRGASSNVSRRPARRRKEVNHYSDDNPNTFTVKRKKGDPLLPPPEPRRPKAAATSSRGRNSNSSAKSPPPTARRSSNSNHHHHSSHSPTRTPTKRKRMRVLPDPNADTCHAATTGSRILAHAVSIQPVMPVPLPVQSTLEQQYPGIFSETIVGGAPPTTAASAASAASAAAWQPIPSAYQGGLLQRQGPAGTTVTVLPPAVTCWTTRQHVRAPNKNTTNTNTNNWFAVGDCTGGVTLYNANNNNCHCQPAALLHTAAWHREQERPLLSKKTISFPHVVRDVTWRGRAIVLRTDQEVQVFWIPETASLWEPSNNSSKGWWTETPWSTLPVQATAVLDRPARLDVWPWAVQGGRPGCDILWVTAGCATLLHQQQPVDAGDQRLTSLVWIRVVESSRPMVGGDDDTDPPLGSTSAPTTTTTTHVLHTVHPTDEPKQQPQPEEQQQPQPEESSFFSVAAIWDASRMTSMENNTSSSSLSYDPILLTVAWTAPDRIDLIRCGAASGNILCRVDTGWSIPTATAAGSSSRHSSSLVADCQLQQSNDGGVYTFLSGYKGIRWFETATLQCLQVFGESVAVHGKTVQWQSCQWVPVAAAASAAASAELVRVHKKQVWLERPDELATRYQEQQQQQQESSSNHKKTLSVDDYCLVGIPHPFKGPDELRSTIHVWKPGMPNNPVTTLQTPAGGCLGLLVVGQGRSRSDGWKLACATAEMGELWEWRASLQSNFAGVMYPTGYQVIQDNIEYIEDEDELDQAVVFEDADNQFPRKRSGSKSWSSPPPPVDDDDEQLARALKLSLLEQGSEQQAKEDDDSENSIVSVLVDTQDSEDDSLVVPCRPDLSLFRGNDDGAAEIKSPSRESARKKDGFESEVLSSLPQTRLVRRAYQRVWEQQEAATAAAVAADATAVSDRPSALPPRIKGKRTKVANVEALLQASIKPDLRRRMDQRYSVWASGTGSSLPLRRCHNEEKMTVLHRNEPTVDDDKQLSAATTKEPQLLEPPTVRAETNGMNKAAGGVVLKALSITSRASDEEKELAMELLLLSPRDACTPSVDAAQSPEMPFVDTHLSATTNEEEATSPTVQKVEEESVVTPSELSPIVALTTGDQDPSVREGKLNHDSDDSNNAVPRLMRCAACEGRMTMHTCGTREKPVDYEAIEKAERERKEKENAEKLRLRIEKRRAADAKRREARKQKKEEEERRPREEDRRRREQEERLRGLEAGDFEQAHIREHEDEPVPVTHGFKPSFSPLSKGLAPTMSAQAETFSQSQAPLYHPTTGTTGYYRRGQAESTQSNDGFSSSAQGWSSIRQSSFNAPSDTYSVATTSSLRQETLRIDGTEVRPSTSLSTSDALAALAGLADSMPVAISHSTTDTPVTAYVQEAFPPAPASWYATQEEEHDSQPTTYESYQHKAPTNGFSPNYDYTGSLDRRTAIAEAFLGSFSMHTAPPGNANLYSYEMSTTPPPDVQNDGYQQEYYGVASSSNTGATAAHAGDDSRSTAVSHGFAAAAATAATNNDGSDVH